jgi:hypothetical protein
VYCTFDSSHAGIVDTPRYRTFPARTRSSNVDSVSSTGVVRSHRCAWYRSM